VSWLVRNWHLKLGALALATVLYTGFVYSGSFTEQTFTGVPVRGLNQPDSTYPLTQNLGTVDVRYRLSADAVSRVTADSFAVTVDLSKYDMDQAPAPQALAIDVRPLANGLTVLSYSPTTVAVQIDRIGQKEVPVVVDRGEVPDGLAIGTPRVSASTAVATGPESQLSRVERAVARVQIFTSGIDVHRQVDLVALDIDGRTVELVELNPGTVTVDIDVRTVETSKTVPVRPVLSGSVADGYEITGVQARPTVVTLFGVPEALASVEEVRTLPMLVTGLTDTTSFDAELSLPPNTRLATGTSAEVVNVEVQATSASRTFLVGIVCQGAAAEIACLPDQDQLAVTVSGPAATLAQMQAGDLIAVVDVTGLAPGSHQLTPEVTLPDGVSLVSISPGSVTVVLQLPATPAPSPPA
jgi:YbbR domain-containing protein